MLSIQFFDETQWEIKKKCEREGKKRASSREQKFPLKAVLFLILKSIIDVAVITVVLRVLRGLRHQQSKAFALHGRKKRSVAQKRVVGRHAGFLAVLVLGTINGWRCRAVVNKVLFMGFVEALVELLKRHVDNNNNNNMKRWITLICTQCWQYVYFTEKKKKKEKQTNTLDITKTLITNIFSSVIN